MGANKTLWICNFEFKRERQIGRGRKRFIDEYVASPGTGNVKNNDCVWQGSRAEQQNRAGQGKAEESHDGKITRETNSPMT